MFILDLPGFNVKPISSVTKAGSYHKIYYFVMHSDCGIFVYRVNIFQLKLIQNRPNTGGINTKGLHDHSTFYMRTSVSANDASPIKKDH